MFTGKLLSAYLNSRGLLFIGKTVTIEPTQNLALSDRSLSPHISQSEKISSTHACELQVLTGIDILRFSISASKSKTKQFSVPEWDGTRDVHLNFLRAKVVSGISELNKYEYSGHSVLVGNKKRKWQNTEYVVVFWHKGWRSEEVIYFLLNFLT